MTAARLRDRVLLALPFVAALVTLPFVIPGGSAQPWLPATIDLEVYRDAAQLVRDGGDIIAMRSTYYNLAFIYPPIAAILAIPLTWASYQVVQVVWTLVGVACLLAVLRRFGVPGDWRLAVAGLGCVLMVEPVVTTLGYGQVNLLLMALVALDVLPRADGRRWLPGGVGTGIAAAVKLTPGLFLVYLFVIGRRRDAFAGLGVFGVLSAVGYVVEPRASTEFWRGLVVEHDTRTSGALTLGNQAVTGFFARMVGETPGINRLALLASAAVLLLGVTVAVVWHRAGEEWLAVAVVGVTSVLAAPLAWSHHFVWVAPLAVVVWWHGRTRLPRRTLAIGSFWLVWVVAGRYMRMPAGNLQELRFTWWQDLAAVVTPLAGVVLLVVLLGDAAAALARRSAADGEPEDPVVAVAGVPTSVGVRGGQPE